MVVGGKTSVMTRERRSVRREPPRRSARGLPDAVSILLSFFNQSLTLSLLKTDEKLC